jgi:GNAT superfamily N-acetyltransferase
VSRLQLRPVASDELTLLAAILAELDDDPPIPLGQLHARLEEMRRYPNYECYLAVGEDGTVVGSLSMIVFPVLARGLSSEAILEAVVVRAPYRGQGFGRAMMSAAMALAADKGAYKLALSSNLRRLDAHRFYEGMGFTRHGVSFSIDVAGHA